MKKEKHKHKSSTDLAYYLTLFTLEGHQTWRAHLSGNKDGFEEEQKKCWGGKGPKISDRRTLRIDRLTGTFAEAK